MNIVYFNNARTSKRKPPSTLPRCALSEEIARIDRDMCSRLVALRTGAGMTRIELARLSNCTPHQIAKYETGESRISAGQLKIITEALGCDINDFLNKLSQLIPQRVA